MRLFQAEQILRTYAVNDGAALAHVNFELEHVAAQQGDLDTAIACYEQACHIADEAGTQAMTWRSLSRNNQAYHRLLCGEIEMAAAIITEALALAEEWGSLSLQPSLLSTTGEVALAQDDVTTAATRFQQRLTLATQLGVPERIAGITVNLGLIALHRGETTCAVHYFSSALAQATTLGAGHLVA